MFFPGETVTHRFLIPFAANEIDKVIFSYKQNGAIVYEKIVTEGFEVEEPHITSIEFQLTQGEGLLFADNAPFTIQVNVYTNAGTRHTSYELSGSSGVQYLREVIDPETLRIVIQPNNWNVSQVGETATFTVEAAGAVRYQWQYSVNSGEWKNCTNGTTKTLQVEATQERIDTHTYRCVLADIYQHEVTTNVVSFIYVDRGDE